jgi:alkylresorcinol/alkylpyrone synthase
VDAVGVALFGDGAAAALIAGSDVAKGGPAILATRTILFEDSKHIMGWRFTSDGMRLILSQELNELLRQRLRPAVEDFLRSHDLALEDIAHWILHPGGRRVIEAYRDALGCSGEALAWTRNSLANVGNLSSASVLFVLADLLQSGRCKEGDRGFLAAPGPGFCAEMLVLGW